MRGPNKPKRNMPRASADTEEAATTSADRQPGSQQRASSGTASTPSPLSSPPQAPGILAEAKLTAQVTTETSVRQSYISRHPSSSAHLSDRPRPPELSLDTVSPYLRLPSDGGSEYPPSAQSSGGHPRPVDAQLSSSQLMYEYGIPANGERSLTVNHLYPESSDGSHSK